MGMPDMQQMINAAAAAAGGGAAAGQPGLTGLEGLEGMVMAAAAAQGAGGIKVEPDGESCEAERVCVCWGLCVFVYVCVVGAVDTCGRPSMGEAAAGAECVSTHMRSAEHERGSS